MRKSAFLLIGLICIVGTVSAQTNQTESRTVLQELDAGTWISAVDWNPENSSQIKVTIYSKIPKSVALQELPDYSGKSGRGISSKNKMLSPGENVYYLSVNGRSTLGVSIADGQNFAYYKKKSQSYPDPTAIDAAFLAFYGAFSTVLFTIGRSWFARFKLKRGFIEV
ncbi:hypothetical protein [Candidatus Nanohalococcus occultus]|uniref:hypothetical protein n=1 Tax=Candidatus Nanohalococcus occultus TaxID=2978047 RepID=UPI0039DFFEDF